MIAKKKIDFRIFVAIPVDYLADGFTDHIGMLKKYYSKAPIKNKILLTDLIRMLTEIGKQI